MINLAVVWPAGGSVLISGEEEDGRESLGLHISHHRKTNEDTWNQLHLHLRVILGAGLGGPGRWVWCRVSVPGVWLDSNALTLISILRSTAVVIGWCSRLKQPIRLISPMALEGSGGLYTKSGWDEDELHEGFRSRHWKQYINVMTMNVCKMVTSNQPSEDKRFFFFVCLF